MTDTPISDLLDVPEQAAPAPSPLTAGQLLQAARLQAGVQLAVLSVTLKVPIKQLEALENDQLDPAKGPVFFRGLTAAVCRQLHTDPAPILALLPQASGHLVPQRTMQGPSSSLKPMGEIRMSPRKSRHPAFWGGLVMIALIAALLWLPGPSQWSLWLEGGSDALAWVRQALDGEEPESASADSSTSHPTEIPETRPVLDVVAAPVAVTMTEVASGAGAAASAAASPGMPISPAPSAVIAPVRATDGSAAAPGSVASQPGLSAAPAKPSAEWVFSADADSWIELRNGPANLVWSGLLRAGQTRQVQSPLPVTVVVGRAQGVRVTLRGKPFDLTPHTQVTVARFEVKE